MAEKIEGNNVGMYMENVFSKAPGVTEMCKILPTQKVCIAYLLILMLIKRRPPQFNGFVENKYRHEHVIITKLYIVSHILYDRHFYEYIL